VSPLTHRNGVVASVAMQLLAAVNLAGGRPLVVTDVRAAPRPATDPGAWNPEYSFGGPQYPDTGAAVIRVPGGYEQAAREAAPHSVAAGIVPLIEQRQDP
jgi:hypothetical protein